MKHDVDVTLSLLRTSVSARKIIIDPKCKRLIYQLENGIWNEQRTKWIRSDELGHCDGVAALGYFNRCARWRKNPFPDKTYDPFDTFLPQTPKQNKTVDMLRKVFKR